MEEKILKGYEGEMEESALELSSFIMENLFNLPAVNSGLRLRCQNMFLKMDKYVNALARYALNKTGPVPASKGGETDEK